jgi:hypothetical protein
VYSSSVSYCAAIVVLNDVAFCHYKLLANAIAVAIGHGHWRAMPLWRWRPLTMLIRVKTRTIETH